MHFPSNDFRQFREVAKLLDRSAGWYSLLGDIEVTDPCFLSIWITSESVVTKVTPLKPKAYLLVTILSLNIYIYTFIGHLKNSIMVRVLQAGK